MKKIILFCLLIAAIGSQAQNSADSIPDWVNNPPTSSKMFYGVGVGKSRNLDIAEKKAVLSANLKIAEQAEPAKVEKIKKTSLSVDGKKVEETIEREVVSAILKNVKMVKRYFFQQDDEYTVYILVEMKKR